MPQCLVKTLPQTVNGDLHRRLADTQLATDIAVGRKFSGSRQISLEQFELGPLSGVRGLLTQLIERPAQHIERPLTLKKAVGSRVVSRPSDLFQRNRGQATAPLLCLSRIPFVREKIF